MTPTSVFPSANLAVATPAATAGDEPPISQADGQTDGKASFARIMSGATADDTTDTSQSSPTQVTNSKSKKDGKHEDDKAQAQVAAQIAATLVPPPIAPPGVMVSTGKQSVDNTVSNNAAAGVDTVPVSPLAIGNVLGQMNVSNAKTMGSDPRNLANAKQSASQLSINDLNASPIPIKESPKDEPSGELNGQSPATDPSSPNASPTLAENTAQPVAAANAGMANAKQVGHVKMQEKTENNSEVAEKKLPPTSLVAQTEATGDSAKPHATSTNLSQREGRNSTPTEASAPFLAGLAQDKSQPAGNNTGADAVRSPQADKVFTEISERVMSFKHMGADSAEVNLRPDTNTEITLSLSLRNGQVEMTARLDRGNFSALNSHWTGLQQSLSQQGVRVGQLTSPQSAMNDQLSSGTSQQGPGENTSRSFERGTESIDETSIAGSMTNPSKGRPQKAVATTGRGWEMWA